MEPQKVSITAEGGNRKTSRHPLGVRWCHYSSFVAFELWLPRLEDEGEVLFPEDDPGRVPADALHVNIDHHQVRALLIRIILHKLEVHHWLWCCGGLHTVIYII